MIYAKQIAALKDVLKFVSTRDKQLHRWADIFCHVMGIVPDGYPKWMPPNNIVHPTNHEMVLGFLSAVLEDWKINCSMSTKSARLDEIKKAPKTPKK